MITKFRAFLSCIRYLDAIVMMSPALVGLSFSIQRITWMNALNMVLFLIASFFLMAHIFSFNDWSDETLDFKDANKNGDSYPLKGVSRNEILFISLLFIILSLLIFGWFSKQLFVLAVIIGVLSIFYSFPYPKFQGKRLPFVSTILHIVGSSLTFLLGYALFYEVDTQGLFIAVYFGLIFAAGHLIQEVQDYDNDRTEGVKTHAVRFGQEMVFTISFVLFTLSYLYIFCLAQGGFVPIVLRYVALLYPLYVAMVWRASSGGLDYGNIHRLRSGYRILYACIAMVISVSALLW